ncbi:MAG: cyclic nucleotide-binding domain-containing protein, partial [Thiohalophilus sp.]
WMLRFLQSRAFLKLPTENIQAILMRMEELPAQKGEAILQQGDQDDYYYIVQSGRCSVSRRPAPKAGEVQLATLQEGDGFGEEALITNGRRNATIRMLEDGVLMRLKKDDFLTYLAEPLINRLSQEETAAKVSSGALLIDVRKHEEFTRQHVEGSVNIPLSMLRMKVDGLNPSREYVLASSDGTQSAAAAFLLTQHGFKCGILEGGLDATSFKLTGEAHRQAATSAAPASKRTAAAEKTRKAAETQARKISQQADTARKEAEQLAQQTASVEQAKRDAEKKIKQQQDEQARKKAEEARRKAEAELQKIQAAKLANEEKQKALDSSLKRAKQIATEATDAAKRARQQAEKEAEEIRRKAREEAEQLKREMEETRRRLEQEVSRVEEEKAARHQAELEQARSLAMEQAEKTTRIAQQEAEEIRRKALEEAEQLRQEMEQTRKLVIEHASRAKEEVERQAQDKARQESEQQAQREAQEQQARQKAAAEERARREAEARRQAEEQTRQQAAEQEKQEQAREARRQQAIRNAQRRRKDNAKRMAEEIKAKLEQAEQKRQEAEFLQRGEGLSLTRATVKRKGDKTILEGPEDIFIFKEPSVTPEQIEAELAREQASGGTVHQGELPSFEIEERNKPQFKPVNTQAVNARLAEQQASQQQQRKKRHVFAVAATLVLALGVGGAYVFLHPELLHEYLVAKSDSGQSTTSKASVGTLNNKDKKDSKDKEQSRQTHENNLEESIRQRFDNLLDKWERIIKS